MTGTVIGCSHAPSEGSRATLQALFRYSHEQGLTPSQLTIEDLFHPASLELGG